MKLWTPRDCGLWGSLQEQAGCWSSAGICVRHAASRGFSERNDVKHGMDREVIIGLRELFCNSRLKMLMDFTQHGDTTCLAHTIAVVYCALAIARLLRLRVNKRELIRGGILHDYFLYDWHDGEKERRIHGFTHPRLALENAENDFLLSRRERDIIRKHMFPLTVKPPAYREAWLICLADKICACREAVRRDAYPQIRRMAERQHNRTAG